MTGHLGTSRQIHDLTIDIVAAAHDPAQWAVVLRRMSEALSGRPLLLSDIALGDEAGPPEISVLGSVNLDPACLDLLFERFGTPDRNPALRATIERIHRPHRPLTFPQFVPDYAAFIREPTLREATALLHGPQRIQNDSFMYAGMNARRRTALKIWRPEHWDFLDASQLRLLRTLSPVIEGALGIAQSLGPGRRSEPDPWRDVASAVLVIGAGRRLRYVNRSGSAMLRAADGLRFRHGRLHAADALVDQAFQSLVRLASEPYRYQGGAFAGSLSIPTSCGGAPHLARIVGVTEASAGPYLAVGDVLVVFEAPSCRQEAPASPRVPGLTRREKQCLEGVASGLTTKQIAKALDLAVDTVAEHIGRARARLGASTRAEAVAIAARQGLLGSPH